MLHVSIADLLFDSAYAISAIIIFQPYLFANVPIFLFQNQPERMECNRNLSDNCLSHMLPDGEFPNNTTYFVGEE